jgi:predicted RNA-binding protein YlqC (UPF0109 family)
MLTTDTCREDVELMIRAIVDLSDVVGIELAADELGVLLKVHIDVLPGQEHVAEWGKTARCIRTLAADMHGKRGRRFGIDIIETSNGFPFVFYDGTNCVAAAATS